MKTEVGGLCALCSLSHFNWSEVRFLYCFIANFFFSEALIHTLIRCLADEKVPTHNVCALRWAIEPKICSPGFTELAKDQLGNIVSEYEISASEDDESLDEFWVILPSILVHLCIASRYLLFCCLVCRYGVFPRMQCQHLLAV